MSGQVTFDGVWKKFRRGERHDSLRDVIPDLVRRFVRPRPAGELEAQEFWAVKDVSFTVKPGEALGIIGHNGAGKSTILKLLTRILRPTSGRAAVRGRIGSLIEVSAGFHPDLTGRENVYLQGAIMGMRQAEIARHFDDIVEFSGISAFIDTPIKRYSSGMNARLGFSIAAHLEPEVLLIDEVLSVGDLSFQQRAFGAISRMVRGGAAVVVVSHQLERIVELCSSAIVLETGQVVESGRPEECVSAYIGRQKDITSAHDDDAPIHVEAFAITRSNAVMPAETVSVSVSGSTSASWDPDRHYLVIHIRSAKTAQLVTCISFTHLGARLTPAQLFGVECAFDANLAPGLFALELSVWDSLSERMYPLARPDDLRVASTPVSWDLGATFVSPRLTRFLSESSAARTVSA